MNTEDGAFEPGFLVASCSMDIQQQDRYEMKAKCICVTALFIAALSGCSTMSTNAAIVPLQTETAKIVGLASSDELTVTHVQTSKPDALGGQDVSYTATTAKGRIFQCTAHMIPGLLLSAPSISAPSCTPVKSHS